MPQAAGGRWRLLRTAYVLLCLGALAWLLRTRTDTLSGLVAMAPAHLLLLLGLLLMAHGLAASTTACLAAWRHPGIQGGRIVAAHFRHLPARLLPGGIWHTVGRAGDWSSEGLDRRSILAVAVGESLLAITSSTLVAVTLLTSGTGRWPWPWTLALTLTAALTALLMALPGRQPVRAAPRWLLCALVPMTGVWLCIGLAFGLLATHWPVRSDLAVQQATGHYLLAWAAGHIAFFAPQGLGVTEAVFAATGHDAAGLALLAAAFRVIMLLGDLLAWLGFSLLAGTRPLRRPRQPPQGSHHE